MLGTCSEQDRQDFYPHGLYILVDGGKGPAINKESEISAIISESEKGKEEKQG